MELHIGPFVIYRLWYTGKDIDVSIYVAYFILIVMGPITWAHNQGN